MRKILCMILSVMLLAAVLPTDVTASSGAVKKNVTIGGKSAALITVEMDGSRTGQLTLGSSSVNKDMPASQHIEEIKSEKGKTLIASVNGGFFNSYYDPSKPLSYPNNYAQTYALLIEDGAVLVGAGLTPMIGFTADGKALIDRVNVKVKVQYRESDAVEVWGVNKYYPDPAAVMLFTDKMGYSVNIPQTSKMVYIKDNIITKITSGGTLTVPGDGTQVLVYNSSRWASAAEFFYEPREGNYARVTTEYLPDRPDTASEWAEITCAVGCGPWLLQGGKDVTSKNGKEFDTAKLGINVVAARSFAAIMPDGSLVLGAATASFRAITDYLLSIGATDALALDGGASSTLYLEGAGFVRPAGRKLSNVLHIVEFASGSVPDLAQPKDVIKPSTWAESYITRAIDENMIPEGFEPSYQKNITRREFCELVVLLLKHYKGDAYEPLLWKTGIGFDQASERFIDTNNVSVINCSRLSIIDGVGGNRFDPNGSLKRQQAAKILKNVAQIVGVKADGEPIAFEDSGLFASWAKDGIDFVTRARIMNGKGSKFDPDGYFTKQEAVITILRLLG